ncbi:MAG: hypothetical protein JWO02_745 [Solirubrobacterales bacterium]|nr:hypothetical protein [Solirubrobacterales bacterium]
MTDASTTTTDPAPKGLLEQLVTTLLYEGYALYPYTPGATKNATPTPFGIVYPPVYARSSPSTFDHLRLQAIMQAAEDPTLAITVLFLEPAGERHEGVERRVQLPATSLAALEAEPLTVPFAFDAVQGHVRMTAQAFHDGLVRVTASVHNATEVPEGLDRPAALRASLLSTHVVATVTGGTFISPIAPPEHAATANMACANVNTFPVLATPDDDVILGAAIVLPDHPQIAPESMGSLFDSTEIEEALLLHLLALSDDEVESIADQDPAVREMLRRAIETTPAEFAKLRGRVTMAEPGTDFTKTGPDPYAVPPMRLIDASGAEVPLDVPTIGDELRGERELVVDGVMYRLGDQVRLRPEAGRNAQDHLLDGRTATIERIYVDYADAVHLCVTVDDDPGQELMRDIGRYLYFKPFEVEALP